MQICLIAHLVSFQALHWCSMTQEVRVSTWPAGLWQGIPGWQSFHLDQAGIGQPSGPRLHSCSSAGPSTGASCARHTRLQLARASPCSTCGGVGIDSLVRWTLVADVILPFPSCSFTSFRHNHSARCQGASPLGHNRALRIGVKFFMSRERAKRQPLMSL